MQFMKCVPIEAYRLIVNSIHSLFEAVARTIQSFFTILAMEIVTKSNLVEYFVESRNVKSIINSFFYFETLLTLYIFISMLTIRMIWNRWMNSQSKLIWMCEEAKHRSGFLCLFKIYIHIYQFQMEQNHIIRRYNRSRSTKEAMWQ